MDLSDPNQRCGDNFINYLQDFTLDILENHKGAVFGLNKNLRINYLNPEWFRFAKANNGEPAISDEFGLGTEIEYAFPTVLREFYGKAYRKVLVSGETWAHEYECSSPEVYRKFHQKIYPMRDRSGILVFNSLIIERPHDADSGEAEKNLISAYTMHTGFITQCCHCRRIQHTKDPDRWDFVVEWVEKMPQNLSHGLCPPCFEYYYKQGAQPGSPD